MDTEITLEKLEELSKFGLNVTFDGDRHIVLYGSECNWCGKYFESKNIYPYCDKCVHEWELIHDN